jgi:Transcriptional regulators
LAKKLYVNKSNVARQVAQLVENGFITRKPDDADKRAVMLYPTEKAMATYPAIREILSEWNRYLVADFTEAEKAQLAKLMERAMRRAADYIGEEGGDE